MKSDSKRRYRMANFLKKLIENDKKELRSLEGVADKVISYADRMAALDDEELRDLTESYKERYQKGETLDDLLPEALKGQNASWDCILTKCRPWAGSPCIKAISPK